MKRTTKYCSATTNEGCPCLNRTYGKYCRVHTNNYKECPICMDDMQMFATLECAHTFCKSCLVRCDTKCPLCRAKTNTRIPSEGLACKLKLQNLMDEFEGEHNVLLKIKHMHGLFDFVMASHVHFAYHKPFMSILNDRITYFEGMNVDVEKHKRRLSSINQRTRLS